MWLINLLMQAQTEKISRSKISDISVLKNLENLRELNLRETTSPTYHLRNM